MSNKFNEFVQIIGEVTRESGESIGKSLKVIYSRVVNAELNRIGIDTENNDVETVILSLASKWKSLNHKTRMQLSKEIAGHYNLSKFLVLMDQLSEAESQ